ncbi:hypothetical protein DFH08DRAFT_958924 [Mycena albidolilacea]|uniref:Uncharacterized protein n=1 Tax=Mycena albidolilacea TaxID=1033008 RepID=A0AAD7ETQ4_9AGAR|nr:hypothetical protein DFH08DRAFT_958924 [Mycena albidolilacea]
MAARRQASARYRERNLEEEREKGRERMARHREKIMERAELAQEFRARARDASRRFHQKNGPNLAHRQRIICLEAYSKKHGPWAWIERQRQLEERRAEAQEQAELQELKDKYGADYVE